MVRSPSLKSLGECAGLVVQIPIKSLSQIQALRGVQPKPKGVNIGNKHQESRELLFTACDSELGSLFDGVSQISAGVGQPMALALEA